MSFEREKPVETANVRAVKNCVRDAVQNNAMAAVIAEVGSGKTTMVDYLTGYWKSSPNRFRVVTLKGFEMKNSRVGAFMRRLLEELNPRMQVPVHIEMMYEALSRELRAFTEQDNRRVILMIDEAQDLRPQTFRDLKKLHEINGHGHQHLMSIILFGKPSKRWKLIYEDAELGYRTHQVHLQSLSADDLIRLAEQRFNMRFDSATTRKRFTVALTFKTPLSVDYFSRVLRDYKSLTDTDPLPVTAQDLVSVPLISKKQRLKKLGITQRETAEYCDAVIPGRKINEQRISEFLNGHLEGELADLIDAAIEQLIAERLRERVQAVTL